MKKLSLTARSLGPLPLDDCLSEVQALGFAGMDLGARPAHAFSREFATPADRADWTRRIADAGLEVSGMAVAPPGPYPLRDASTAEFATILRFAADLGTRMLRLEAAIPPDSHDLAAVRGRHVGLAATCKAWARLAADEGVRLVWDYQARGQVPMGSGTVATGDATSLALDVLAEVDEPNFGLVFRPDLAVEPAALGPFGVLDRLEGAVGAVMLTAPCPDLADLLPALLRADLPTAWWTLDLDPRPDAREAAAAWVGSLDAFLAQSDP